MTEAEAIAALDQLEAEIIEAFGGFRGQPSVAGHDRELDIAVMRLEESVMWMRRAVKRKFS